LEATIDLKGCRGEHNREVPAQIVCDGEQAKVRYEGSNYLYQGYAKQSADGNWGAVGIVNRYLKPGVQDPEVQPKKERKIATENKQEEPITAPVSTLPKPAEPKLAEAKPAEPKPAEAKPAEPKPAEPKPADTGLPAAVSKATEQLANPPTALTPAAPAAAVPVVPAAVPSKADTPINPWVFNAWFRFRSETSDKTDMVSNRSFNLLKVRPSISYNPAPYATLAIVPQFAKTFGDVAYVGASTTTNALQETSGTTYDPSLSLHQAFADLHPTDWFRAIIGRQILSYGDELVVGALEWNNIGRSFDAGKARISYSLGWTDLFASKTQENNAISTGTVGDKDFYGLYNSFNLGSWFKEADLYLLYLKDATSKVNAVSPVRLITQNLWTAGIRLKSTIGGFDHREELTKQWLIYTGVDGFPQSGSQADMELGYSFVNLPTKPRLGIEGFYSSKDYNQLFPTVHKWLGYADVLGRRNVSGYVIHASSGIVDGLRASFDYHYFLRTDTDGTPFKLNGTTAIGSITKSGSKLIGSEADLTLSYQITKILNFTIGGSLFIAGDYIKDQAAGPDTSDFYYLQMDMKL
jgi:hypothetical protein